MGLMPHGREAVRAVEEGGRGCIQRDGKASTEASRRAVGKEVRRHAGRVERASKRETGGSEQVKLLAGRAHEVIKAADTYQKASMRSTHLMDCNVVFTLSISLIATMPSVV